MRRPRGEQRSCTPSQRPYGLVCAPGSGLAGTSSAVGIREYDTYFHDTHNEIGHPNVDCMDPTLLERGRSD